MNIKNKKITVKRNITDEDVLKSLGIIIKWMARNQKIVHDFNLETNVGKVSMLIVLSELKDGESDD